MDNTAKKLDQINENLKVVGERLDNLAGILIAIHQELERANQSERARNFMNRVSRRR